jgi:lipoprotein-anchoring transpeptidase ErfK/SrfK
MRNAWLVRGGEYDLQTRVGNFHVFYRDIDHVSSIYDTPMPYSQFFSGGQALHGSGFMVDPFYEHSHGCINMYIQDARQLWRLTSTKRLGVSVYGSWD